MKLSRLFVTAFVLVAFAVSMSFGGENTEVNWDQYSKNLINALKSDNMGLKLSAMQMVIQYKDYVDVSEARFEVMDVFQKSDDRRVRQLALVTLHAIGHTLDMGRLERQVKFEEDPVIQKQIMAILFKEGRLKGSQIAYKQLARL